MNQATQLDSAQEVRTAGLKFAYASGARPLPGYTIKRGVGRGGFGEVYYAVSDAGKEVALKLIRRNLDVELRGVTHCLNMKHPNLLVLHDVRQDDEENSWVVMEYVSGESLEEVIQRNPDGMPPEQIAQWMHGIAAGVGYLHDHGIVHRDLKPGNIFSDEGIVKLGDYGLSKFISCSRRSGQTESVGTVHYMAPEVANGRYGKEIDIYALGIILYEMLTGSVPFEGESVGEVLMKHLTAEPDLARLPEPFRTIVGRALAKDPAVRIRSVAELMEDLPRPSEVPPGITPVAQLSAPSPRRSHTAVGERPVVAQVVSPSHESEEPIERALRKAYSELKAWWSRPDVNTPLKVLIVVGAGLLFFANATVVVPVLGVLLLVYGGYRLVRGVVLHEHGKLAPATSPLPVRAAQIVPVAASSLPTQTAQPLAPSPPPAVRRVGRRAQWRLSPQLPLKAPRERLADLLGSLLLAAGVAAAMSLVMVLMRGEPPQVAQYAWLSLTSTLGAWLVLLPSKIWEGRRGDPILRRFTLLVLGFGLGAVAFVAAGEQGLLLNLELNESFRDRGLPRPPWDGAFYANGKPLIFSYLAYFAFLFLLVRWWRQADPLRGSRLSLWATGWSVLAAAIVNQLWEFPQPWGLMIAATTSLAVQLSSPWIPPADRQFESAPSV